MNTNIINFPQQTYLGITVNQLVIGITLPKRGRRTKRSDSNLVFLTVLLKLRKVFSEAIKEGKIELSLEGMEWVTTTMAKEYCRAVAA